MIFPPRHGINFLAMEFKYCFLLPLELVECLKEMIWLRDAGELLKKCGVKLQSSFTGRRRRMSCYHSETQTYLLLIKKQNFFIALAINTQKNKPGGRK